MNNGITKLYYSIGEVSELIDVEKHVLRYWENKFQKLSPSKNSSGNRVYKERDINIVKLIKHLLYDKKYTIEGAKNILQELSPREIKKYGRKGEIEGEGSEDDEKIEQYKNTLGKIKKELKSILEVLEKK